MHNILSILLVILFGSCNHLNKESTIQEYTPNPAIQNHIYKTAIKFSNEKHWIYDAEYYNIPYPNGDVPSGGACTDVVIRVLRAQNIDLQQLIHEDMSLAFEAYPNIWGLRQPDSNIDHRRVPNIMRYFERKGYRLPVSNNLADYQPGDIVTWKLGGNATHIGICLENGDVYHNIGPYAKIDKEFLFNYSIIGHYRL
ncbi:MAG: DUF1287 domain-containing protein [Bacteroidota bacterium]|jgi:uncharacterized protein YijF (DUF1287 family)